MGGVLRFAGFELDQQRVELRSPSGSSVRLRRKTFDLLWLFATNPGRLLSKHELMAAVWPNVHVGEDSLFQCVREIRAALGDDSRQLIKAVSGRGYLFETEVSGEPVAQTGPAPAGEERQSDITATGGVRLFGLQGRAAVAAVAGLCTIGLAVAMPILAPGLVFDRKPPIVAVTAIVDTSGDRQGDAMAVGVTDRLIEGLTKIDNIRVVAPPSGPAAAEPASAARSDFVLRGELQKSQQSWTLQARVILTATGEVHSVATVSVDAEGLDAQLQQSRLAAGVGQPLARSLNTLLEAGANGAPTGSGSSAGSAKVVIEQAMASINQTSRERFTASQAMLESALAGAPDNVDLQVALVGLQTRGIQMVWYDASESAAAKRSARSLLERALQVQPRSVPVLEANCRFLTATNNFVDSLVACARVLSFDPWNGSALYQLGLTQLQMGRFEDALATFRQADRFNTPEVSRWTWLLGVGWANLLLDREADAVPWLQRSIAITPASGRPYMLLAVAYQRLGRLDEAKAALARGMELRPGSTALNIASPWENTSPVFVESGRRLTRTLVEIGLPEN